MRTLPLAALCCALAGCTMTGTTLPGMVIPVADMPQHCFQSSVTQNGPAEPGTRMGAAVATSSGYVVEGLVGGTLGFSCFYAPDGEFLSVTSARA